MSNQNEQKGFQDLNYGDVMGLPLEQAQAMYDFGTRRFDSVSRDTSVSGSDRDTQLLNYGNMTSFLLLQYPNILVKVES